MKTKKVKRDTLSEYIHIPQEILREILLFYRMQEWWFNAALVCREWRDTFKILAKEEEDVIDEFINSKQVLKCRRQVWKGEDEAMIINMDPVNIRSYCFYPTTHLISLAIQFCNLQVLKRFYTDHGFFVGIRLNVFRPTELMNSNTIEWIYDEYIGATNVKRTETFYFLIGQIHYMIERYGTHSAIELEEELYKRYLL